MPGQYEGVRQVRERGANVGSSCNGNSTGTGAESGRFESTIYSEKLSSPGGRVQFSI